MPAPRIARDLVPIAEFKAHASALVRSVREEDRALVITANGRPAAVLIAPDRFDRLAAREQFLESVCAGLADSEAGRVVDDERLDAALARRTTRRRE